MQAGTAGPLVSTRTFTKLGISECEQVGLIRGQSKAMKHRRHHHRVYHLGGWVAPLCPAQFSVQGGVTQVDQTPAADAGDAGAGDAGAGDAGAGASV